MNNPSVRINFNFNAAPTDFPERRGRTQDGFGIALVFVKSFTDKFSRLASEEINNDFTVRNRLLFFRNDLALAENQRIDILLEYFCRTLEQLPFDVLRGALNRGAHDNHRAARTRGDIVGRHVCIELGNGDLFHG